MQSGNTPYDWWQAAHHCSGRRGGPPPVTGRPPPQWRAAHHRGGRPTTTLVVSCHHHSGRLLATGGRHTYDQKLTYYYQTDNMCSGTLPPRWCVACHHSGGLPSTAVVGCLPSQWWAACCQSNGVFPLCVSRLELFFTDLWRTRVCCLICLRPPLYDKFFTITKICLTLNNIISKPVCHDIFENFAYDNQEDIWDPTRSEKSKDFFL